MEVDELKVLRCTEGNWYILIIPVYGNDYREFYIGNSKYCVMEMMFGCEVADENEAIAMAKANILEYAMYYMEEYFDDELEED